MTVSGRICYKGSVLGTYCNKALTAAKLQSRLVEIGQVNIPYAGVLIDGHCHDLAYGESLPTTGRIIRGLSQHTYLDYVQVRMPTGPVPLPVDGTSQNTGLRSRTTRRNLGTE